MTVVRKLGISRLGFTLAVLGLILGGCANREHAPVYDRSKQPKPRIAQSTSRIPVRPAFYTVRRGDSLYKIAFRYGLDFRTLARWNRIPAPYTIYPEQRLRLSPPRRSVSKETTPKEPVAVAKEPSQSTAKASEPTAKPNQSNRSANVSGGQSTKSPQSQPKPVQEKSPPPAAANSNSGGKWLKPSSGSIVQTFAASDPNRRGVRISGKGGQPVIASAAGKVVYSGAGLIGYGEMVIIKHSQELLTAYALNSKRLVKEGEQVSAGQTIAEMGPESDGEGVLHFEVRKNGKPIDPLRYISR